MLLIPFFQQFKDDLDLLNSLARDKSNAQMVHNINQENPQIREIHSENIRLRASLEDYQRALEHIMTKYREHSQSALAKTKVNFEEMFRAETEKNVVSASSNGSLSNIPSLFTLIDFLIVASIPVDPKTSGENSGNDGRNAEGRHAR